MQYKILFICINILYSNIYLEREDYMNDGLNCCYNNNGGGLFRSGGSNSEILLFLVVFLLLFTNFGCCGCGN